jgi:hypothetical protein
MRTISMGGFDALKDSQRSALMAEFKAERTLRVERCRENLASKRQLNATKALIAQKTRERHESQIRKQIEEARELREVKRKEWEQKTRINDAIRAKEKEEMRKLAESGLLRSARLPLPSYGKPKVLFPQSRTPGVDPTAEKEPPASNVPRATTPPASTRSALAEYMKFSLGLRKREGQDQAKYRQQMDGTNYAQNVKLASTVYSRQLRI